MKMLTASQRLAELPGALAVDLQHEVEALGGASSIHLREVP